MAKRSGIIALGLINGDWHLIAPYSEGRGVQTSEKAYGLAKGGIINIGQFLEEVGVLKDNISPDSKKHYIRGLGQSLSRELDAHMLIDRSFIRAYHGWGAEMPDEEVDRYIHQITANVEFREETGIDISMLEKGGYDGVQLIRRSEIAESVEGRKSENSDLYMDVILIENIAGLIPHLKGKNKQALGLEEAIEAEGLPSFEFLHERLKKILTEGECPKIYWEQFDASDQFLEFMQTSQAGDPLFSYFRNAATQIKDELYDAGVLKDDLEIKLDNRISPLCYYREGADILSVNAYADAIRAYGENYTGLDAHKLEKYKRKMLGDDGTPGQLDIVYSAVNIVKGHRPSWVQQIQNSISIKNKRFIPASYTTKEPVQAVLFDFDDVLMDTATFSQEVYEVTFREMESRGYPLPDGISYADREANEKSIDFMQRIFVDPDVAKEAYSLKKQIDKVLVAKKTEGAKKTLQFLRRAEIPFAVISNSRTNEVQARFNRLFGEEFEDTIVLGDAGKPDAARIMEALNILGVPSHKKNVLYIGDRIDTDAEAAIAAGCYPVLFGPKGYDELEKAEGTGNHPIGYVKDHAALRLLIERRLPQQAAYIH